jgi:glycosyltransferase involved in cell wall biosynthesis
VFSTKFPYKILSDWGEKSLAVSEDIKAYLMRNYNVPAANIFVTVNGVDTDTFAPNPSGKVNDGRLRVMTVSRLDQGRSQVSYMLVKAAPAIYGRYPNALIVIVGGGGEYENIKRRADDMNKRLGADIIEMTGPRTDVHRLLATADVFVGASRAALEAMSSGLPVVASGNEGHLGLLTEGSLQAAVDTNFCYRDCERATVEKLTADVLALLGMPVAVRERMGALGRAFVLENYSVARMADDALALYRTVLDAPCPVTRVRTTDVLISGYYGYNNSGDDLLLQSIVNDLKSRRADLRVTVLSMRPRETRELYGGVGAVYRFNLYAIWRLLHRTRLLLTGGGSVI